MFFRERARVSAVDFEHVARREVEPVQGAEVQERDLRQVGVQR